MKQGRINLAAYFLVAAFIYYQVPSPAQAITMIEARTDIGASVSIVSENPITTGVVSDTQIIDGASASGFSNYLTGSLETTASMGDDPVPSTARGQARLETEFTLTPVDEFTPYNLVVGAVVTGGFDQKAIDRGLGSGGGQLNFQSTLDGGIFGSIAGVRPVDGFSSPTVFSITLTRTGVVTFDLFMSLSISNSVHISGEPFVNDFNAQLFIDLPENVTLSDPTGLLLSDVAEPSSSLLLGIGLIGLVGLGRRVRKQDSVSNDS